MRLRRALNFPILIKDIVRCLQFLHDKLPEFSMPWNLHSRVTGHLMNGDDCDILAKHILKNRLPPTSNPLHGQFIAWITRFLGGLPGDDIEESLAVLQLMEEQVSNETSLGVPKTFLPEILGRLKVTELVTMGENDLSDLPPDWLSSELQGARLSPLVDYILKREPTPERLAKAVIY